MKNLCSIDAGSAQADSRKIGRRRRVVAITLRGLAWDHKRCWGPLEASARAVGERGGGAKIVWDRRSLYEFGEGPLNDVLRHYDLVVFDHPFIGDIARDELLIPFDDYLSAGERRRFEADSVGASWASYQADGRQWALPIDAAAQVASYRPDLLTRYGSAPRTHDELITLAKVLRTAGKWIGLPLVPTDAMCLLLTFAAAWGEKVGAVGPFLPGGSVVRIIGQLRELASLAHRGSQGWNPIACYEHMIANDDVVYTPYAFGYVNYAARRQEPHLRFADVPMSPPRGALLGGAGIGVSAFSKNPAAAVGCALALCSPDYQRGNYVRDGGQPGSLGAWMDDGANVFARNFFKDTLATLQGAYLRPTHPGFVSFFREASPRVQAAIVAGEDAKSLANWLEQRYSAIAPSAMAGAAR
jgi:multiple sugar transport system substrate-binding protein